MGIGVFRHFTYVQFRHLIAVFVRLGIKFFIHDIREERFAVGHVNADVIAVTVCNDRIIRCLGFFFLRHAVTLADFGYQCVRTHGIHLKTEHERQCVAPIAQ